MRNVTHKLAPVLHINLSWNSVPARNCDVLGSKANGTSASWNDTLLGYAPNHLGEVILFKKRRKSDNRTKVFWGI